MAVQIWLLLLMHLKNSVIKSFNPYKPGVLLLYIEKQKIALDVKQQNTTSHFYLRNFHRDK